MNGLGITCLAFAASVLLMPRASPAAEPEKAAPLTVDRLLDNMETVRKTLKTFKADVVKLREPVLESPDKFVGNIQFKSPRLLRLQLKNTDTGAETIYIVGKEFAWIYRPQQKQAERGRLADIASMKKAGNPLEYGLARDLHGLREGYQLKLLPAERIGETEAVPLEMTPEGGTTYAKGRLIFWIDLKTWLPVQVREYKSNDELVETHTFTNIRVNEAVPDSAFEFTPPKDVEVNLFDVEKSRP